jgi:hypothetical protein
MAYELQVEYPGAIYHLMNRLDRRDAIWSAVKSLGLFLFLRVHSWLKFRPEKFSNSALTFFVRRG